MELSDQVSSVLRRAKVRSKEDRSSLADEMLLFLMEHSKEQAKTIRDMAQAVSAANEKCAGLARGSTVKS